MTARRRLQWSDGALGALLNPDVDLDWQDRALCAEVDPEIFFPDLGQPNLRAKKVCRGCEVSEECLLYALSLDEEPEGVWGGYSEWERHRMRKAGTTTLPPAVTVSEKHCPRCETTKPAAEFWKNPTKSGGLATYCIPCDLIRRGRVAA